MSKNKVVLLVLIGISIAIVSLYTTYAINVTVEESTPNTYDKALTFELSEGLINQLTIEAGKTKVFDIDITNPYTDSVQYGIGYELISPTTFPEGLVIAQSSLSKNSAVGLVEALSTISISLIIVNETTSDVKIELSVINGYKNGGDLIVGDKTLIEDVYQIGPLDNSGANTPDLTDGLIPVMYDTSESNWVVADSNNMNKTYQWYDYDSKMWANAVLVNDTLRSSLTKDSEGNYTPGQAIGDSEADGVLAFYVWIPRYKYKVWNIDKVAGTDTYDAYTTGIDIVFESGTSTTGTIICNYDFSLTASSSVKSEECTDSGTEGYYTHPAFTFGDDELTGFWMGKFEISSTDQTSSSYGGGDSDTLTPRILPNVRAWGYNYVDKYWKVIYNMQATDNEYGLTTDRTKADSHMLTNMEWGAVAYLTNSSYGRCNDGDTNICIDVSINNSKGFYTGRSSGAPSGVDETTNGTFEYDEKKIETTIVEGIGTSVSTTITNDTTYPWTETDGVWSSGNSEIDDSSSSLIYSFALASVGMVSFDYSYSSESGYDKLQYTITNSQGAEVVTSSGYSGTSNGTDETSLIYNSALHVLEAESYILTITYTKDSSDYDGLDKAYIKNIEVLDEIEIITNIELGGVLASTTGNVYGVYDMSGGSYEYVMGNVSSSLGNYIYFSDSAAGTDYYTYTGYEKYVTTYSYGTTSYDQTAYNRTRLGDATGEIILLESDMWGGWYSEFSYFPRGDSSPWVLRSGNYGSDSAAGLFFFDSLNGLQAMWATSRASLTPL